MESRFLKHVNKTDTCWNWTGFCNEFGYGKFRIDNKTFSAHRIAYELWKGSIPIGLHVRHTCIQNRKCVNPDHLLLGTHRENMNDVIRDETQNKKLTKELRDEIRILNEPAHILAQRFGVCESYVYRLKRNSHIK